MNLISPYLTLGFCLKTWASQLRVVHPTVRPCNHARIRVTSTFDRILYIGGCDIEASIPFPLPSSSWKIWKSHKEATLRRQESKTASSSPKLPVGLVWKLCVPIGAEKNPILNPDLRNYRLLATLHWLKLFWCDHFFMLQSVQLWHLKIYRWHKHPITAPVAHWCLHLQCLKDQRDPFTPFTLFIRGSSRQRHHPTSKNSGSSWGKGHQGVLKSLAQSRNGGQDLIPWCTWCICGLDSAQMSLVDTIIIYIYIYNFFQRPILLGGSCQFGVPSLATEITWFPHHTESDSEIWNARRICSRKMKVKVQYLSYLNWCVAWPYKRWVKSWNISLLADHQSKIGDGHDDHDMILLLVMMYCYSTNQLLVLQGWIHVMMYSTICQIPGKPAAGRTGRNVHSWL